MARHGKGRQEDITLPPPEVIETAWDIVTNMAIRLLREQHYENATNQLSWGEVRFAVLQLRDVDLGLLASITDPTLDDERAEEIFRQLAETTGLAANLGIAPRAGPSHSQNMEPESPLDRETLGHPPTTIDPLLSDDVSPTAGAFPQAELTKLKSIVDGKERTKEEWLAGTQDNTFKIEDWVDNFLPRFQHAQYLYDHPAITDLDPQNPDVNDDAEFWDAQIMEEHALVSRIVGVSNIDAAMERLKQQERNRSIMRRSLDQAWQQVVNRILEEVTEARSDFDTIEKEMQELDKELSDLRARADEERNTLLHEDPLLARHRQSISEIIDWNTWLDQYLTHEDLPTDLQAELTRERAFQEGHRTLIEKDIRWFEMGMIRRLASHFQHNTDQSEQEPEHITDHLERLSSLQQQLLNEREHLKERRELYEESDSPDILPLPLALTIAQFQMERRLIYLQIEAIDYDLSRLPSELTEEQRSERDQRVEALDKVVGTLTKKIEECQHQLNELTKYGKHALQKFDAPILKLDAERQSIRNRFADIARHRAIGDLTEQLELIEQDSIKKRNITDLRHEIALLDKKLSAPTEDESIFNLEAERKIKHLALEKILNDTSEKLINKKEMRLRQLKRLQGVNDLDNEELIELFARDGADVDSLDQDEWNEFAEYIRSHVTDEEVAAELPDRYLGDWVEASDILKSRQSTLALSQTQELQRHLLKKIRDGAATRLENMPVASEQAKENSEPNRQALIEAYNLLWQASLNVLNDAERNRVNAVIQRYIQDGSIPLTPSVHGLELTNALLLSQAPDGTNQNQSTIPDFLFAQINASGELLVYQVPDQWMANLDEEDRQPGNILTFTVVDPMHEYRDVLIELTDEVNILLGRNRSYFTRLDDLTKLYESDETFNLRVELIPIQEEINTHLRDLSDSILTPEDLEEMRQELKEQRQLQDLIAGRLTTHESAIHRNVRTDTARQIHTYIQQIERLRDQIGPEVQINVRQLPEHPDLASIRRELDGYLDILNDSLIEMQRTDIPLSMTRLENLYEQLDTGNHLRSQPYARRIDELVAAETERIRPEMIRRVTALTERWEGIGAQIEELNSNIKGEQRFDDLRQTISPAQRRTTELVGQLTDLNRTFDLRQLRLIEQDLMGAEQLSSETEEIIKNRIQERIARHQKSMAELKESSSTKHANDREPQTQSGSTVMQEDRVPLQPTPINSQDYRNVIEGLNEFNRRLNELTSDPAFGVLQGQGLIDALNQTLESVVPNLARALRSSNMNTLATELEERPWIEDLQGDAPRVEEAREWAARARRALEKQVEDFVHEVSHRLTQNSQPRILNTLMSQDTQIERSAESEARNGEALGGANAASGNVMQVRAALQGELSQLVRLTQLLARLDLPANNEDRRRELRENFLREAQQLRDDLKRLNQPMDSAELARLKAYAMQGGQRNTLRQGKLKNLKHIDIYQTLQELDEVANEVRQARNNVDRRLRTLPPERHVVLVEAAIVVLQDRYPGGNYTPPQRILDGEHVNGTPFFQGNGIVLFQQIGQRNTPIVQAITTAQLMGRTVTMGKSMNFIAGSSPQQNQGQGRKR